MAKATEAPGPLPAAPDSAGPVGPVAFPEPPPPANGGCYVIDPATGLRTPLREEPKK